MGYYNPYQRGTASRALIEHLGGKPWKIQRSPKRVRSQLLGVAATSPTNAWTVGNSAHYGHGSRVRGPFARHWNGRAWKG